MSSLDRHLVRPVIMLAGMGYLIMLAVALIGLHMPPEIVLGLTVGGILLVGLIINPLFGVHALLMLLSFENVAVAGDMTVMKLIGPLIFAGWLISLAIQRKPLFKLNGFVVAMFAFLLWGGVSLTYAIDSDVALSRLFTFVQLAFATLMIASVVNTPSRVRGILLAIVTWTTIATISSIGMYYLGMQAMVKGFGENRNMFALYIDVALGCSYVLYHSTSRPEVKFLMLSSLPILFLGLALTFSRGGFIVMILVLLLVWYRFARERRIGLLIMTVLFLITLSLVLPSVFWDRVETILPTIQAREGTVGIRIGVWEMGMEMFRDRPMTGVGLGNFVVAVPRYAHGEGMTSKLTAHNTYVEAAAETGLIGLGLFLLLQVLAIRAVYQAMRAGSASDSREIWLLAVAAESSMLAIVVAGLNGSFGGTKLLWIFFGLAISLGRFASAAKAQDQLAYAPIAGIDADLGRPSKVK